MMKAQKLLPLFAFLGSIGLYSCQPRPVLCDAMLKGIGLKVIGDTLTDFYTLRLVTADTIRRRTGEEAHYHTYLVLDDTYQPILVNKPESFRFIGKIGQKIVVREDYVLEADPCHVNKVSGKDEVHL